jgi:hypothetical protein
VGQKPKTVSAEPAPIPGSPKPLPTEPQPQKGGPRIKFEKAAHDFGDVDPGAKKDCEFKFTNVGDSLLKITNVRVSSPCCLRYTLKKKRYAPGESGTLKVTYLAGKRPGAAKYSVSVSTNDKVKPKRTLVIKAKVVLKVAHKPKELKLLLKQENAGCPEITLTSIDNQLFAIRSFKSPMNCISASFDMSKKATEFLLQPKVDIEKLKKSPRGYVRISLTHPKCGLVTILYSVLPEFEITPRSILALNAEPQKPIKRKVWILNNYGEDFEVESVSSKKDIIKVLSRQKVGNRYKFELEITPPAPVGKRAFFTDVFYVNMKGGQKLSINCRGFYSKKKKSG